jgi:hypothetical protein
VNLTGCAPHADGSRVRTPAAGPSGKRSSSSSGPDPLDPARRVPARAVVEDPVRTLNNVVDGLSNGSIWALIALGYTLVYGIIELINFAHGEVFMIGSFISVSLYATLGITEADRTSS